MYKILNDELINLIYSYSDNEHNKKAFNQVIQQLNLKRLMDFIKYNIFEDDEYIQYTATKISRVYIIDMLSYEDIPKYTDYNDGLNRWNDIEFAKQINKINIAKNLKNHNELYKHLIEKMRGCEEDFTDEFYYEFVIDSNYFDEKIMKNEVFINYGNYDYDISDEESSEEDESSDYSYNTDSDETEETDESDENDNND